MGFCTNCGAPRAGASRFCTKCGAEFRDQAATGQAARRRPAPPPAEDPTLWDQPASGHPPTQDSLSFLSPGLADPGPASPSSPTSAPSPGVVPTGPMPPGQLPRGPEPRYRPARTSGRGHRRTLFVAVVVVVVLAAGGGAFALVSSSPSGHPAAGPSARPATAAPSRVATTTAPATPTPSAAVSPGTVVVAAGAAANPAAPQVTALLNQYFNAINTRNYAEYSSLLDAQMRAADNPASFAAGYMTTKDTAETLTSISSTGGGNLAATVSFTSQQSPADSIDQSPCNDWLLTLYLVPQGSGYVITAAPSGYQPTYSDC